MADSAFPNLLAPLTIRGCRLKNRIFSTGHMTTVVAGYGSAAARLVEAGLDGVEIVASQGYLPAQFLNPRINRRDDEYGGSPENRLRFLRQAIAAVRRAVGPDIVVGMRISGDEMS